MPSEQEMYDGALVVLISMIEMQAGLAGRYKQEGDAQAERVAHALGKLREFEAALHDVLDHDELNILQGHGATGSQETLESFRGMFPRREDKPHLHGADNALTFMQREWTNAGGVWDLTINFIGDALLKLAESSTRLGTLSHLNAATSEHASNIQSWGADAITHLKQQGKNT